MTCPSSRSVPRSAQCRSSSASTVGAPAQSAASTASNSRHRAAPAASAAAGPSGGRAAPPPDRPPPRRAGRVGRRGPVVRPGVAQRLEEGLVRDDRLLEAASRQDRRPAAGGARTVLGDEAGLADPRLAADQREPALAVPGGVGGPPEAGGRPPRPRRKARRGGAGPPPAPRPPPGRAGA